MQQLFEIENGDLTNEDKWCDQSKPILIRRCTENVLKRTGMMETYIKQETKNVVEKFGFTNTVFNEYATQISSMADTIGYVQWIYEMKTPQHQSNHKRIESMKSMEQQLRNRYNYLLANNFGDSLFPALFEHCFDYARYVSATIFPKASDMQQKELLLSILKKSYWLRVLNAKIEDFKQTKPVPFICKRSLCCSSRRLNKLLKRDINEEEMTRILNKKNIIPPQYEKFPKTLEMATVVIAELFDEEIRKFETNSICPNNNIENDENSDGNDNFSLTANINVSRKYTKSDTPKQNNPSFSFETLQSWECQNEPDPDHNMLQYSTFYVPPPFIPSPSQCCCNMPSQCPEYLGNIQFQPCDSLETSIDMSTYIGSPIVQQEANDSSSHNQINNGSQIANNFAFDFNQGFPSDNYNFDYNYGYQEDDNNFSNGFENLD